MKVLYYPGCTLKTNAKAMEESALEFAGELGVELVEMKRWNCCGTNFNLTTDNFMHQLGPIRNLIRVQEAGEKELVTLCSVCYATLKRANQKFKSEPDFAHRVNFFMDEEPDYRGEVEVFHFLRFIKDRIGFGRIKELVKYPLDWLRVGCYYGCQVLRPEDVGIDDKEHPRILEDFVSALGATPVEFSEKIECCGNFATIAEPEFVANRAYTIIESARKSGANLIITSCPLCHFNLDRSQVLLRETFAGFVPIPIMYFTEIGLYALKGKYAGSSFVNNLIDPKPAIKM